MNIDDELQALSEQETTLAFTHFDAATAWELGAALKTAAERRGLSIAIEIQLAGQTLFYYAMPGATPDIADWVRRKRNLVNHFHKSSYAIGLRLQQRQTSLEERYGLSVRDYSVHGGAFPLTLTGLGCVGSISISGAPQKEDHQLLVSTLAHFLGLSLPALH
ncbi:TPA: heme-degrading domain-containing protein [Serratia marcescens]|uniref:heme-degrading domain-containing protein n=1 Tax=Serratia nevei TaxID=2703794 RepID=UPI003832D303